MGNFKDISLKGLINRLADLNEQRKQIDIEIYEIKMELWRRAPEQEINKIKKLEKK